MKWMLVVMVFGVGPVKTNLLFDSIDSCLRAEDAMRAEYARTFNEWQAAQNPAQGDSARNRAFIMRRNGLENPGTCIPHAPHPSN